MEITEKEYRDAELVIETFKASQERPQPLPIPNYKLLKESTERYIDLLSKGVISNDDFKEEIFICAMESVFGENIWVWVRTHRKVD